MLISVLRCLEHKVLAKRLKSRAFEYKSGEESHFHSDQVIRLPMSIFKSCRKPGILSGPVSEKVDSRHKDLLPGMLKHRVVINLLKRNLCPLGYSEYELWKTDRGHGKMRPRKDFFYHLFSFLHKPPTLSCPCFKKKYIVLYSWRLVVFSNLCRTETISILSC